tara:strand:+ start:16557 stop:17273 length:717 start_codon:yes stop_codon:yes gene_type:complete
MDNLKNKLTEELNRFNQISYNSIHLEEQVGGLGGGSGFVDNLGSSERLEKYKIRQQEMSEQEDVDVETTDTTDSEFPEMPEPPVDVDGDSSDTETTDTETTDTETTDTETTDTDTTELDVTELVSKQGETVDVVNSSNEKLDSLMSMLGTMEDKLSGMDTLMKQINNLEKKIEKNRPKTEEEKMSLRKQDSGPYNQTLSDYWDDSQDKFKEQGKDSYVLKASDVQNYSDGDIKNSFDI